VFSRSQSSPSCSGSGASARSSAGRSADYFSNMSCGRP
jgi:hypothetical protein